MKYNPLKGLLALIAFLLVLNLVVSLQKPTQVPAPGIFPPAHAAPVLDSNRPFLYTASENGDILYVWELGDYVGESYESVRVTAFQAAEKPHVAK